MTGDIYRMNDLFKGSAPTGQTIAGYRVALGAVAEGHTGGDLRLNGVSVLDRPASPPTSSHT